MDPTPPTDLTLQVLIEIRDELKKTNQRVDELGEKVDHNFEIQNARIVANLILGELAAYLNQENIEIARARVSSRNLGGLVKRIADGSLSSKLAKDVFDAMWAGEGDADAIIEKRGLKQITDSGELEAICDQVMTANAKV